MKFNFNKDKLMPIVAAVIFLVLIVIAVVICMPLMKKIYHNNQNYKTYLHETNALKNMLAMSSNQKSQIRLPDESRLDAILEEISKVGIKNNITLDYAEAPTEDTANTSELFKRMLIEVNFSNDYKHIGNFLSDLRSIPDVIVDIEKMMVSSDLTDSSKILVHLNMVLYLLKRT